MRRGRPAGWGSFSDLARRSHTFLPKPQKEAEELWPRSPSGKLFWRPQAGGAGALALCDRPLRRALPPGRPSRPGPGSGPWPLVPPSWRTAGQAGGLDVRGEPGRGGGSPAGLPPRGHPGASSCPSPGPGRVQDRGASRSRPAHGLRRPWKASPCPGATSANLLTGPGVASCCSSGTRLTVRRTSEPCPCHFLKRPGVRLAAPGAPRGPGPVCSEAGRVGCTSGGHAGHAAGPPGALRGGSSPPRTPSTLPSSLSRGAAAVSPASPRSHTVKSETTERKCARAPPPPRDCGARPGTGRLAGRPSPCGSTETVQTGGRAAPRGQRPSRTPWRHPETAAAPAEPVSTPGCSHRALCTPAPPPCPRGPQGSRRWPGHVSTGPWALEGHPAPALRPQTRVAPAGGPLPLCSWLGQSWPGWGRAPRCHAPGSPGVGAPRVASALSPTRAGGRWAGPRCRGPVHRTW